MERRIFIIETFLLKILLILFNIYAGCKDEPPVVPPPPSPVPNAVLSIEGVTCTEAWLKLELENFELPVNVSIIKDSIPTIQINNLTRNDTVVFIDSLLPNQTYKFQSTIQPISQSEVKSNELTVTTLDTTSHNFSWETFEFGDPLTGYSSILYDVAIINENNIWAVGEIYLKDSLGETVNYNAVHWNGDQWEIKRIRYYGNCSAVEYPVLKAIWAFSDSNIVITNGGSIGWFNGNIVTLDCRVNPLLTGVINKLWGTSSNNLYAVGNNGNIAHYNGSLWTKIESGTDLALTDIYAKNENEVYAAGINVQEVKGVVLKGNVNGFSVMINSGIISENELFGKLYGDLASVWIDENNTIYAGGNLLYQYKNSKWDFVRSLPENYIGGNIGSHYRGALGSIRGNASNDYIIAGDRNTLRHFNGVTWEQLGLPYSPSSPIGWTVEQKSNIAIAVGLNDNKAIIMVLK